MADHPPTPSRLKVILMLQFINGLILLVLSILCIVFFNAGRGRGQHYYIAGCITAVLMMFLSPLISFDCNSTPGRRIGTVRCGIVLNGVVTVMSLIASIIVCLVGIGIRNCSDETLDFNKFVYDNYERKGNCVDDLLIQNRLCAMFSFIFLIPSVFINAVCTAFLYLYLRTLNQPYTPPPCQGEGGEEVEGTTIHPCVTAVLVESNTQQHPDKTNTLDTPTPSVPTQTSSVTPSFPVQAGYYAPGVYEPFVPPYNDAVVSQLHEQNRLLREQLALQQQLIQQQQQLRQQQQQQQPPMAMTIEPSAPSVPPSYESCIRDPTMVQNLESQNRQLQAMFLEQQEMLPETKSMPP